MKKFTLVSTVFNESSRLQQSINDIEAQTLLPNEIIIVDAGSNDGTFEQLLKWSNKSSISIVIVQEKECNVAKGRNIAIQRATHELIVSTDFGCQFHPGWLKSIVSPFEDKNVKIVGGAYGVQEDQIISIPAKANFVLTDGYKNVLDDYFIPSSRSVAYYKSVWEKVNGYPEWLTLAADDLVFGKVIKSQGYPIYLVNQPYVYWGRHTFGKAYVKEAYRYGLGDGEAQINQRNVISNFIELILRHSLFTGALLFFVNINLNIVTPLYFLLLLILLPGFRSYIRTIKNWLKVKSSKYHIGVVVYGFLLIERTRINYIRGYVKGYFFSSIEQKKEAQKLNQTLY